MSGCRLGKFSVALKNANIFQNAFYCACNLEFRLEFLTGIPSEYDWTFVFFFFRIYFPPLELLLCIRIWNLNSFEVSSLSKGFLGHGSFVLVDVFEGRLVVILANKWDLGLKSS